MLTSAGRSRRINESTALGVGSTMSIRRLWVRISNCSRLSLYLCGERITTKTFFSVGSGTGPTTVAPARVTVSTILRAELSMTSWSYDFSRMRIFCPAIASSDSLSSYVLLMAGSMDFRPPRSGVSHPFRSTNPCAVRRWSRGSIGNPAEPGLALPLSAAHATSACEQGQEVAVQTLIFTARQATCLLYTSDAADDLLCVDLGGR